MILLAKVIHDQKNISYAMLSDQEFRVSVKSFADDLSRHDQQFATDDAKVETSSLEYSLLKSLGPDRQLMNILNGILNVILQKYYIPAKIDGKNSIERKNIFKREENEEIQLELPYANSECWHLGPTHFGGRQTESGTEDKGTMASIDMAPSLFQKWGVEFDYLFSNGEVYAAHSGYFKKHSECSFEVRHEKTLYSTYYSHAEANEIEDGTFIEQGEDIGRIQLDPDQSNCKCDWPSKSFVCATGPHLHLELRYNGSPASLDGKIISNLRIKAGKFEHDNYCSDPEDCTEARYEGKPCATTYTNLKTGEVICPITKGTNIGRKQTAGLL